MLAVLMKDLVHRNCASEGDNSACVFYLSASLLPNFVICGQESSKTHTAKPVPSKLSVCSSLEANLQPHIQRFIANKKWLLKAFAKKYRLPFTLLSDEGNKVRKERGVPGDFFGSLPGRQTYFLDKNGAVQLIFNNQFN